MSARLDPSDAIRRCLARADALLRSTREVPARLTAILHQPRFRQYLLLLAVSVLAAAGAAFFVLMEYRAQLQSTGGRLAISEIRDFLPRLGLAAVLSGVAVASLITLCVLYVNSLRRRAAQALRDRQAAESALQALRAAVAALASGMHGLAEGDLRIRATPDAADTRIVAENLNGLIERVAVVVSRFDAATLRISGAIDRAALATKDQLAVSEVQARELRRIAGQVASSEAAAGLRELLRIVEQASAGAQEAAVSIQALANLVVELKTALAGFRLPSS